MQVVVAHVGVAFRPEVTDRAGADLGVGAIVELGAGISLDGARAAISPHHFALFDDGVRYARTAARGGVQ